MTLRTRLAIGLVGMLYWVALTSCGGDVAGASDASRSPGPQSGESARPARTETPADQLGNRDEDNHKASGAPQNVVQIVNKSPKKLRMRSNIQLNRISGDSVTPLNAAVAVGQDCTGCQTIAVALQIDLYKQGAHVVSPENYSVALNLSCTSCVTISHAIQYAIPVTDPENDDQQGDNEGDHQGADARKLLKRMQKELDDIAKTNDITADQAEGRIRVVLAEFRTLANAMLEDLKRADQTDSPNASPLPSPSATGAANPTSGGASPAGSAAPTTAPSPTATATASP